MKHKTCRTPLAALWRWLIPLLLLWVLVACAPTDEPPRLTDVPTVTEPTTPAETQPDTPPATEPETPVVTVPETAPETIPETLPETIPETVPETEPQGWKPDMGVFNEGKVTYGEDADGNITATPAEGVTLGLDITDKQDVVGICYSIWFDYILGSGTKPVENWANITEILAGNQSWGGPTQFHYWAKPEAGYYRSSDRAVIRRHMTQLYTAGVDFIILDHTNLHDGYLNDQGLYKRMVSDPMVAIFDTIMEMRAEGLGTPYVVVWCGDSSGALYRDMYDNYYGVEKWRDCFVYWDGLPLLLTTHTRPENFPLKSENLFTVRSMWGLGSDMAGGQWNYLTPVIAGFVTYAKDGSPEHIGVSTAAQRGYMGMVGDGSAYFSDATGRNGGRTWYTQWYFAFAVRPKIVTLTWWNEWAAQRLPIGNGQYGFVDNFNMEYSRDIEPMEGGHGDQYYRWLIEYISAYKGHLTCPLLVEEGQESNAKKGLRQVEKWLEEHGYA